MDLRNSWAMELGGERKKRKVKSVQIPSDRIEGAIGALVQWLRSKESHQKPQLLEQDEFIYLVLTMKKIPSKSTMNPTQIRLPNPVYSFDGSYDICLIVGDRVKTGKDGKAPKKRIKEEGLPISKVLRYSKLRADYRPFEAKRKLCGSFDLFLADRPIVPHLPKLLGKTFFVKKKHPIPVDLSHNNWSEQFKAICSSAFLYIWSGCCSVVKIGKTSQTIKEIAQNIEAVVDSIGWAVPGKWDNIRSLHVKSLESVALPLYQVLPDMPLKIDVVGSVKADGVEKKQKQKQEQKKDKEISTDKVNEEESVSQKRSSKKDIIRDVRYMDFDLPNLNLSESKKLELPSEGKEVVRKKRKQVVRKKRKQKVLELPSEGKEVVGKKRKQKVPECSEEVKKVLAKKIKQKGIESSEEIEENLVKENNKVSAKKIKQKEIESSEVIEENLVKENKKVSAKKIKRKEIESSEKIKDDLVKEEKIKEDLVKENKKALAKKIKRKEIESSEEIEETLIKENKKVSGKKKKKKLEGHVNSERQLEQPSSLEKLKDTENECLQGLPAVPEMQHEKRALRSNTKIRTPKSSIKKVKQRKRQ